MLDFNRTVFEIPMVEEFFTTKGLTAQTGQPSNRFGNVVVKELVDNSLDAAEYVGTAPKIQIRQTLGNGLNVITVADNGSGISPATVERILNFQTRTSDKAAYRTPSRGAQGNALKTVFGIPHAMGVDEPVIIESHRVRHSIRCWLDPAGQLRIDHQKAESDISGTSVSVPFPYDMGVDAAKWARGFSLFNPHATFLVKIEEIENGTEHAQSENVTFDEIYQNTASDEFRKFSTKDMASAHWYDSESFKRLVYLHISDANTGGKDILLRDFVQQFRGLSSTVKAKAICDRFSQKRLSDFDSKDHDIFQLLETMKAQSQPPKPQILGIIGEDHFHGRFEQLYGIRKFYYRKRLFELSGIPYVVELAICRTDPEYPGGMFAGINYSMSFNDPIQAPMACGDKGLDMYSLFQLRHELADDDRFALAFHLASPALNFTDRGKTHLSLPRNVMHEIAGLIWDCSKELYTEKRRRDRSERAAIKAEENAGKVASVSLKDSVFSVMWEAYEKATGLSFPIGCRQLFYQVRPLIQQHTDKELDYNYFSQTLLTDYRQNVKELPLLYYDPRGVLYEPHTGQSVPLGTREVDAYEFPSWLYNKILYIEKKGFWPVLQAAKLAERYDMAIVVGEGYACEAVRTLFRNADSGQGYRIFVMHDADPYGYDICRTLREETARMPGYHVDIIDMGLFLKDAIEMGLQTETFFRSKSLPEKLELTEFETEKFIGVHAGKKTFKSERVELNAMTSAQFLEYIENKLADHGATDKVIPDDKSLPALSEEIAHRLFQERVEDIISQLLSIPEMAGRLFGKYSLTTDIKEMVEKRFEDDRSESWRDAIEAEFSLHLKQHKNGLIEDIKANMAKLMAD